VGSDGETHQGVFDESFLINMPNMSVCMGKDEDQYNALMEFSKTYMKPLAIRYPHANVNKSTNKKEIIEYGKWIVEQERDSETCIITFGPKVDEVREKLNDVTIVNAIFQSPIDMDMLKELTKYKHIVIYNPYGIEQGFAFHVIANLNALGYKNNIHTLCLKNEYIKKGTIQEQEKRCNVDVASLETLINRIA
jgi:1-deoxy-D-xylulose-5-phosphate synthase